MSFPSPPPRMSMAGCATAFVVLTILLAIYLAGVITDRYMLATSRAVPAAPSSPRTVATAQAQLGTPQPIIGASGSAAAASRVVPTSMPAASSRPTPRPTAAHVVRGVVSGTISGQATWWDTFGSGYYAAIRPDLGSKGDAVVVCGGKPFHCRTAPIITTCACRGPDSGRIVDLSADLFADFAPLSRGVIRVSIEVLR